MSESYDELMLAYLEQGREFAKLQKKFAELEANNAILLTALSRYDEDPGIMSMLNETPADSLAAVRREAMEKMCERIIDGIDTYPNDVSNEQYRWIEGIIKQAFEDSTND